MKRLSKLVVREHISPEEIVRKKAQKYILGGYGAGDVIIGKCSVSAASGCGASCSGNDWCTIGNYHVACDEVFYYCS